MITILNWVPGYVLAVEHMAEAFRGEWGCPKRPSTFSVFFSCFIEDSFHCGRTNWFGLGSRKYSRLGELYTIKAVYQHDLHYDLDKQMKGLQKLVQEVLNRDP